MLFGLVRSFFQPANRNLVSLPSLLSLSSQTSLHLPGREYKKNKNRNFDRFVPFFFKYDIFHISSCVVLSLYLFGVGKYFNSEQELLLLECDRGGESKWSESVLQGEEGRIWFPSKINDHSWRRRYRISNYLRHCCLIWNVRLFYHFIKGNIASKFTNFFWGLYIQQHDVICSSPSSSKTSQPAG